MDVLHLLMPGLSGIVDLTGPDPTAHRRAPGLARVWSRSHIHSGPPETAELLCRCFGMTWPDGHPPVAALTGPVDTGHDDDAYWLRMDPVHLRAGAREIVMTDPAELHLDAEANQMLGDTCVRHLAEEGIRLELGPAGRWYLLLAEAPDLVTRPPSECLGRDVASFLPAGGDARLWRRRLTELQMVLAASPVNEERAQHGLPVVNSVWLWGGGRLPAPAPGTFGTALGDDILLVALARWASWPLATLPEDYQSLIAACRTDTAVVLIGNESIPPPGMPTAAPCATVERLEQSWFGPLERAVGQGRIETLWLYPGRGLGLRCTRAGLRRFWRRPRLLPARRPVP